MCQSCEALTINGLYCHEHGCPDAWKDVKCKLCGRKPGDDLKPLMCICEIDTRCAD